MKAIFKMSDIELSRSTMMDKVKNKFVKQIDAAELLGISDRHFRKLWKAYKKDGPKSLVSKRRGRPSNNRYPEKTKKKAISLIRKLYQGFGPTLCTEKLFEEHGITVSRETVRGWILEEGLWKS